MKNKIGSKKLASIATAFIITAAMAAPAFAKDRGEHGVGNGRGNGNDAHVAAASSGLPPGIWMNFERGKALPPGIAKRFGPFNPGQGQGQDQDDDTDNDGQNGTTTPPAATTTPIISSISVFNVTTGSADIYWLTQENADSKAYVSASYPATASSTLFYSSTLSTFHHLTITGLTASTTYYVMLTSTDASGNTGTSSASFATQAQAAVPAPTITFGPAAINLSSTSATIFWVTSTTAGSALYYSTSTPVLAGSSTPIIATGAAGTIHNISLSGLATSTTYYYLAVSADASGQTATSTEGSFTTLP
ncbi:hypothetical protein KGP36_03770 [Patescibacteria group bacterium]|nr:hypothetical protein [Patescibacteria group bacterium]